MEHYRRLFENYGLKTYYNQECFALNLKDKFQKKFYTQHQEIKNVSGYTAEHFQKKYLKKYAADFHEIYNKAWATHDDGKQLTLQQAENIFKSMKAVVEEKIV